MRITKDKRAKTSSINAMILFGSSYLTLFPRRKAKKRSMKKIRPAIAYPRANMTLSFLKFENIAQGRHFGLILIDVEKSYAYALYAFKLIYHIIYIIFLSCGKQARLAD